MSGAIIFLASSLHLLLLLGPACQRPFSSRPILSCHLASIISTPPVTDTAQRTLGVRPQYEGVHLSLQC
ncbi:hypothetical protein BJV74DRAFT_989548, partial [Russula compacta]